MKADADYLVNYRKDIALAAFIAGAFFV